MNVFGVGVAVGDDVGATVCELMLEEGSETFFLRIKNIPAKILAPTMKKTINDPNIYFRLTDAPFSSNLTGNGVKFCSIVYGVGVGNFNSDISLYIFITASFAFMTD